MDCLASLTPNIIGSGRPNKRQKTNPPSSPTETPHGTKTSTPRSSGKESISVMIHGSGRRKRQPAHLMKHHLENDNINEVYEGAARERPGVQASPADSTARGILTLQEETHSLNCTSVEETPSKRRKGRPRKLENGIQRTQKSITISDTSTKSNPQPTEDGNVGLDDKHASPTQRKQTVSAISKRKRVSGRIQVDLDASTKVAEDAGSSIEPLCVSPVPRSTGRERKKSQRQIEAEESDTIVLSGKRKSADISKGGIFTDQNSASRFSSRPAPIRADLQSNHAANVTVGATPTAIKKRGRPRRHDQGPGFEIEAVGETDFDSVPNSFDPGKSRDSNTVEFTKVTQQPFDTLVEERAIDSDSNRPLHESLDAVRVTDRSEDIDITAPPIGLSAPTHMEKFEALVQLTKRSEMRDSFIRLKEEISQRLAGKKLLPLIGLDSEYRKVRQLVEQTIVAGEGNSMLVIGSRGSAKTTLVETAIDEMKKSHPEEFHIIRLNGFIHTDDKVALKEIWRQLGREMQVEEETNSRHNYADTLTSLLALLSHPNELSDESANLTAKSVIFIIDEFDLFASHPRQTLLYNLFDIAQSRKAPIAVLGLTTRIDVTESLEKRVKSRFSHRYVHLSLPKTLTLFLDICRVALCCPSPETTIKISPGISSTLVSAWSAYISGILVSGPFSFSLKRNFACTKSIPQALTSLLPAFLLTRPESPPTPNQLFTSLTSGEPPDSKLVLLHGLPLLSLALLISAARLDIALSTDAVTFAMTYDEYTSLTNRTRVVAGANGAGALNGIAGSGRLWSRDIALGAWETLCDLGLLVPVTGDGKGGDGRLWRCDVSLEEIGQECRGDLGPMVKWCREMVL